MKVLIILLSIAAIVFGIAQFIKSKKSPKIEAKVINKPIKKEYPKKDQKDIAIEKYKKAQK
jgi:Tfp pilus assembly protein PilO